MTTDTKPKKVYPSSSGFIQGNQVVTEYNSACLRYILVASKAKRTDLDPLFAQVGAQHEDWYAAILGDELADRELVLKTEILPGVEYSGRCDFVDTNGVVHETKATLSKNGLYGMINKGEWKINHLAQLVSYLIYLKRTEGKIAVGYYEKESESATTFIQKGFRVFTVGIRDSGAIVVDGVDTGLLVMEQLEHRYRAAKILETGAIAGRPRIDSPWKNPCNYCPVKSTCDEYDAGGLGDDEFISAAVRAVESAEPMKAKVNVRKKRGKQ
jgi:hypothetical protein